MVQRYAIMSPLAALWDLDPDVDLEFIIANPSSYTYLTPHRYRYTCGSAHVIEKIAPVTRIVQRLHIPPLAALQVNGRESSTHATNGITIAGHTESVHSATSVVATYLMHSVTACWVSNEPDGFTRNYMSCIW